VAEGEVVVDGSIEAQRLEEARRDVDRAALGDDAAAVGEDLTLVAGAPVGRLGQLTAGRHTEQIGILVGEEVLDSVQRVAVRLTEAPSQAPTRERLDARVPTDPGGDAQAVESIESETRLGLLPPETEPPPTPVELSVGEQDVELVVRSGPEQLAAAPQAVSGVERGAQALDAEAPSGQAQVLRRPNRADGRARARS
jgi:hypothetical protein